MKIAKLKILLASALLFLTASAQALQPEVLYAFQLGPRNPQARLVQGNDGNFYGTTYEGGSSHLGTVFRVTTNGVLTTLVSFNGTNGARPVSELVLGTDGNFYGTTYGGGISGLGTVFTVRTNGVLTILVSFSGDNGANPYAGLVLGTDGNFYGTTLLGGSSDAGTVFKVTTNGGFTTLLSFSDWNGTDTNGAYPWGVLVQGIDGNFYGTASDYRPYSSDRGNGSVFKMTADGVLTTLVSFDRDRANGWSPRAGLVLGADGNFYGTTAAGGSSEVGTVFKVTTNGVLTILVSFNGDNGANPESGLVLGADGNFYGTTVAGGSSGNGTVFRVTTNGVLTSLISFTGDNGANPVAGLVLGRDGYFYGTTSEGGPGGAGTIFRLVISAFTSVARQPGGSVLLTGSGPINGSYRLWASPDLSLPVSSWTLLTSASFASNGNFSYTDAGAATNSSRFYQLSVP